MERKILEKEFVQSQIKEWAKEEYPLTQGQQKQAEELFYKLMKENQNINKSLPVQEGLLAEVSRKLSYGEEYEKVFGQHNDTRHLNFYNEFLGDGTLGEIVDALGSNNISTSVLKGIQLKSPHYARYDTDAGLVEVSAYVHPSPGEEDVNYLDIKLDGNSIYSYLGEEGSSDDFVFGGGGELPKAPKPKRTINKDGRKSKSLLVDTTITATATYQTRIDSRGVKYRANDKGVRVGKDGLTSKERGRLI